MTSKNKSDYLIKVLKEVVEEIKEEIKRMEAGDK